jgi:hypothetical protein
METVQTIENINNNKINQIQQEIDFYREKLQSTNDMIERIVINSHLSNLRKQFLSSSRN